MPASPILAPRRGRPRKFARPSSPVTLTLPVDVIEALRVPDGDLSRAIVRLAQTAAYPHSHPPAELITYGKHAVIAVTPSKTLERRTGVSLVPLPDGRALISFEQALTIPALELLITDALEDASLAAPDREIFQAIETILRTARRAPNVSLLQRSIIVLRGLPAAAAQTRSRNTEVAS